MQAVDRLVGNARGRAAQKRPYVFSTLIRHKREYGIALG